jgi:esterase/lipase superfamily enzyme
MESSGAGEGAPSLAPDIPAGGAAPPSEITSPAPAPPPAAQPPTPPAAPGAAARAGAEAEAGAAAVRRADEEVRAAKAARDTTDAKAAPPAAPVPDPAKAYDVVPVFYGTDRAVETDPDRLQFGSERGHKLQLGRALVTVPLIHKVPHIERPVVIEIPYFKVKIYEEKEDPEKHFTVQEIKSLTEDEMLALVRQRLATSATFKNHAFVFVHGFNTSFDCALYRTAQIAYDLHFDGVPFLYSWPSGGKIASYTYDHGSVEQAEPTLTEFLKLVIQKSGATSISLIAHSMGNELLLRVLERLKPHVPSGVVISQVILAAPDVDRDKFNIIAREITNFAKGVTLYAASNDRALSYSARFWGGVPRAGDIPKSGPLIIPGVDTIDVTAVSTDALGLNHSGYAENPALLNDVKALVEFGIRPPDKRLKGIETVQSEAGIYWRFEAAK